MQWRIWGGGAHHRRHRVKRGKNTAVTIPLGQMPPAGKHTQRYNALGSGGGRRSCFPVRSGPSAWGTDQPTQLALPHTALLTRLCCHTHVKYSKMPHRKPERVWSLGPAPRPEEHLKTFLPWGPIPLPELQQGRGRPRHKTWSKTKELYEMVEVLISLIVVITSLQIHGSKYHNVTVYVDYTSVKLRGWGGGGGNVLLTKSN